MGGRLGEWAEKLTSGRQSTNRQVHNYADTILTTMTDTKGKYFLQRNTNC